MSDADFQAPRTGFFPSLAATLNHILAVDLSTSARCTATPHSCATTAPSCRSDARRDRAAPARQRRAADRLVRRHRPTTPAASAMVAMDRGSHVQRDRRRTCSRTCSCTRRTIADGARDARRHRRRAAAARRIPDAQRCPGLADMAAADGARPRSAPLKPERPHNGGHATSSRHRLPSPGDPMPVLATKLQVPGRKTSSPTRGRCVYWWTTQREAGSGRIGLLATRTARTKHLARGKLLPRDRVECCSTPARRSEIAPLALRMYVERGRPRRRGRRADPGIGRVSGVECLIGVRRHCQGRHLFPADREEAPARARNRAGEPPAVHLPRRLGAPTCPPGTTCSPTASTSAASSTTRRR